MRKPRPPGLPALPLQQLERQRQLAVIAGEDQRWAIRLRMQEIELCRRLERGAPRVSWYLRRTHRPRPWRSHTMADDYGIQLEAAITRKLWYPSMLEIEETACSYGSYVGIPSIKESGGHMMAAAMKDGGRHEEGQ